MTAQESTLDVAAGQSQQESGRPSRIYVSFSADIRGPATEQMQAFLANKLNEGVDSFYILFSSMGGSVKEGITLYNFLKSLPADIVMHNIGRTNSIANVVFSGAKTRYAVEHSSFMFHGVGFDVSQSTRFEEKHLKEKLDSIENDQRTIADILKQEMGLAVERTREMFLSAAVITSSDAKELGIVHDVRPVDIPKGAQLFQLVLQK